MIMPYSNPSQGFRPEELKECPICKVKFWNEILNEHALIAHNVEIKDVLEVSNEI